MDKTIRIACTGAGQEYLQDLVPLQGNLKDLSKENYEKLKKEILELGFSEPISVWVNEGKKKILNGHQRIRTLNQMVADGFECPQIPVCYIEAESLREAKQKILALTSQYGEITKDGLYEFMHDAGFTMPEIEDSFRFPEIDFKSFKDNFFNEPTEGEDDVPEVPKVAKTKLGELWLLGEHRLLCGDSTDKAQVERLMGGEKADLIVTSPPYNCGIDYDTHDDEMPVAEYEEFIRKVITNCVSILGDGRFTAWNVGTSHKSRHSRHAQILADSGLNYFRQIVWLKTGVSYPMFQHTINANVSRNYLPNYQHEVIFLFCNGTPQKGGQCDIDEKYSSDVWSIHQSSATADIPGLTAGKSGKHDSHGSHKAAAHPAAHPAAYPVAIPAGAIRYLTSEGEIVFDPFGGAGGSLIAAEKLKRRARIIEISELYADLILNRWTKHTGKQPVREDGEKWPMPL